MGLFEMLGARSFRIGLLRLASPCPKDMVQLLSGRTIQGRQRDVVMVCVLDGVREVVGVQRSLPLGRVFAWTC